jgi:hypothetical protein
MLCTSGLDWEQLEMLASKMHSFDPVRTFSDGTRAHGLLEVNSHQTPKTIQQD